MESILNTIFSITLLFVLIGCSSNHLSVTQTAAVVQTTEVQGDVSQMPDKPWPGIFLLEEPKDDAPRRALLLWRDGNMRDMVEYGTATVVESNGGFQVPGKAAFFYTEIRVTDDTVQVIGQVPETKCYFYAGVATSSRGMMPCLDGICGYMYKAYFDGEVRILPESRQACQDFFESVRDH